MDHELIWSALYIFYAIDLFRQFAHWNVQLCIAATFEHIFTFFIKNWYWIMTRCTVFILFVFQKNSIDCIFFSQIVYILSFILTVELLVYRQVFRVLNWHKGENFIGIYSHCYQKGSKLFENRKLQIKNDWHFQWNSNFILKYIECVYAKNIKRAMLSISSATVASDQMYEIACILWMKIYSCIDLLSTSV